MKTMNFSSIGLIVGITIFGLLAGCVYTPRPRTVYVAPTPEYGSGGIVMPDDYVYYPGYQVYYSSNRRQYVYQEGRSWVARPAPPRVAVEVLLASPSVRLDFHDAPSLHHSAIVRQYPKHWSPPAGNHGAPGNREEGKRNEHGGAGR